MTSMFEIERW